MYIKFNFDVEEDDSDDIWDNNIWPILDDPLGLGPIHAGGKKQRKSRKPLRHT